MSFLKKHLVAILVLLGLWRLYRLEILCCPFLFITHLPCPTCGITRALDALLQGDGTGYLRYHPLALPLAVTLLLFLHRPAMGRAAQRRVAYITVVVLAANTVFFLFRLQHYATL